MVGDLAAAAQRRVSDVLVNGIKGHVESLKNSKEQLLLIAGARTSPRRLFVIGFN